MKIGVIGTGYVGLVTGTCLSEIGHDVICMDIDESKVARLRQGETPIFEPGLEDLVQKNVTAGRLHFTSDLQEMGQPAVIFFALPTPPNGDGHADLSYVLSAAKDVAKFLKQYTVLVNKSTVPVGTAQQVRDTVAAETETPFDVVSNPEFLKEGFAVSDFMNAERIVVGTSSDEALAVMEELYRPLTAEGVRLITMDEASSEMTKYAANSFLATKISFMNEVANLCELVGANVDMVRQGIGSDGRIGNRFLNAGIGYGGSCFPKDVMAFHHAADSAGYDFKILSAVMDVNARQEKVLINKITKQMGDDLHGKTFALWGLAFKANTDDIREAPSLEIIRGLLERGASVQAYDPEAIKNVKRLYPTEITYAASATEALQGADALIVVTEWKEFIAVEPAAMRDTLASPLVFDGRNVFDPQVMTDAGLTYISIGRPAV
ncbi:MAG TPA: UDP-glucose/GDP-mannose dehydrogenase family protein [Candidatus Saccharimonadales bacterium]|jgi:UDPglucose 6-dehydrogenase|nr:UDP-glucose/GDP-mannose dehydrogenase family protein [Candidatus Saccharimonadales bacterium]